MPNKYFVINATSIKQITRHMLYLLIGHYSRCKLDYFLIYLLLIKKVICVI